MIKLVVAWLFLGCIINFIIGFIVCIICIALDIDCSDGGILLVPLYWLYILIKCFKTIIKNKKENKIKQEQEKYTNISNHLILFTENNFGYYSFRDIKEAIETLIHNYKTILQNEFHKELAYSRLEYLLKFLEECKKNEMIKDDEILTEVRSMVESLNKLFQQIVDDINDINTKANNELKEHIKSITKRYVADTNQMIKDFKEYNK